MSARLTARGETLLMLAASSSIGLLVGLLVAGWGGILG